MSQSPRTCPNCGTPAPAGQRFCSNCGTDLGMAGPASQPSQYGGQPQSQPASHPYDQSPYAQPSSPQQPLQPLQPMQSPPGQAANQQYQQYQQYQQPPQKSNGFAELLGALGLVFFMRRYRPGYQARRQSSGCCGCLIALIILGFIFGIPGYLYYRQNPHFIQNLQNQIQHSVNSGSSGNLPAKQPAITTKKINQTVTYAGVDITIVSAQQSSAFIDDGASAANGMIRVNIREAAGAHPGIYSYSDVARLILPDKSQITPINEQNYGSPSAGTTRDNWFDFSVPTSDKIDQLKLLLGTDQQATITVPLTGSANLSTFQLKTSSPNVKTQYAGMTWTVTKATWSLSANGNQAVAGMAFVTLTLRVDNPSARDFIAYWGDYARLTAGGNTSAPSSDSTLPTSVAASSSGTTGTLVFQVPSGGGSYTLLLLNTSSTPYTQASADFQI